MQIYFAQTHLAALHIPVGGLLIMRSADVLLSSQYIRLLFSSLALNILDQRVSKSRSEQKYFWFNTTDGEIVVNGIVNFWKCTETQHSTVRSDFSRWHLLVNGGKKTGNEQGVKSGVTTAAAYFRIRLHVLCSNQIKLIMCLFEIGFWKKWHYSSF